jgi:hypothetical protein
MCTSLRPDGFGLLRARIHEEQHLMVHRCADVQMQPVRA